MELGLEGKLVLVTGSTKGIGLVVAKKFATQGAHVIVNGRDAGVVASAAEQVRGEAKRGSKILEAAFDLGTAEGCDSLMAWLGILAQPVDILVNNLGIFEVRAFAEISDAEWMRFFEVNVMSGVRLCRALFPGMLERRSGSVVFISSEAGVCPKPFMVHYSMTKAAQLSIARGLAEMAAGIPGVRVNTVMPGPTLTEGVKEYLKGHAHDGKSVEDMERDYVREVEPTSLLQRFIDPEEIAQLVVFVASNRHSIQGASIPAEGGIIRHI